ncbi:translation initiation factor IF-2, partial [Candidatus Micrarchaeota archaeon]|nr:translation initiation factor IF-2 [Candidatus Micrarchaeota archaeon]
VNGWISKPDASFAESLGSQRDFVQKALDEKLYDLVGKLGEQGFNSERFDRVTELTKQVLIVPVSAKTGEGFSELLLFLAGLSQRFMEKKLHVDLDAPAIGTVLEVKKTEGLGPSVDAIIYEGSISSGDGIAVATTDGPIVTKVRALLQPAPLEEIRDPRKKFKSVERVSAAAGVKVAAPGLEKAISGSPLFVVPAGKEAEFLGKVRAEVESAVIETENVGVIVKTDALGSLEALASLFSKENIRIRRAGIGGLTKRDVAEARSVRSQDRYAGAIFVFNSAAEAALRSEAENEGVPVFEGKVVYSLIDDYKRWENEEKKRERSEQLARYVFPAKLRIIPGNVFRASKPAVVGVEVISGALRPKYSLINEGGERVGTVESIQIEKNSVDKIEAGAKAAVAIGGATVGRNLKEGMLLYSDVPREQLYELLERSGEKELIKEILRIKEGR